MEASFLQLLDGNANVRKTILENSVLFNLIDVIALLRESDFHTAQNYYHVFKKKLAKNGKSIPETQKVKQKTANNKYYFTEVGTKSSVEFLLSEMEYNLEKRSLRINVRRDDEI